MHRSCSTCKYVQFRHINLNLDGNIQRTTIHECTEENAKRGNNNHTPTVEFARNDHFGVCGSVGLLHVEKPFDKLRAGIDNGVDYHAKRMAARAKAQAEMEF